jgi:prepilin-type N-terminal cleavage/methylation domain-containing protein
MKSKIKAFTLIELVIVLILICFVTGFAISFYLFTYKNYMNYKSASELFLNYRKINFLIDNDFFINSVITKNDRQINFKIASDITSYEFNDHSILRFKNGVVDTLFMGESKIECFMKSQEVDEIGSIDELKLSIRENDLVMTYHFLKDYDAVTLMGFNIE